MSANNLTETKSELIGSLVQRELINAASLTPFLEDLSSLAVKGVSSISIPKLSSFTVQDRGFGSTATDNTPLTDSKDTINLSNNKIVKWGYDAADAMQSSIDYQIKAAERASSAHGRNINSEIVSLWEAVAGLNINGGTPADITAENILTFRKFLMDNGADMSLVNFIVGTDSEKVLLGLPEFSRYDVRGGGAAPIVNGTIGSVYGIPVIVNTSIKDGQAFMVEKSGSAIAIQRAAKYGEQSDLDYGTDGKKAVVDMTYGLGGLQLGEAGVASTESPLICKLID